MGVEDLELFKGIFDRAWLSDQRKVLIILLVKAVKMLFQRVICNEQRVDHHVYLIQCVILYMLYCK